jgi:hypothetical protein
MLLIVVICSGKEVVRHGTHLGGALRTIYKRTNYVDSRIGHID